MNNKCKALLSEVQVPSESTEITEVTFQNLPNNETTLRTPPNNGTNVLVGTLDGEQDTDNEEMTEVTFPNIPNNETTIGTPSNNGSYVLIETLDGEQVSLESVFCSAEKNKSVRSMKKKLPNKRKKKSNEPPFTERMFKEQIRKRIGVEKRQLLNESLVYIKPGHIQCMACKKVIECLRSVHCHCTNNIHKNKLIYWNEEKMKQSLMSAT